VPEMQRTAKLGAMLTAEKPQLSPDMCHRPSVPGLSKRSRENFHIGKPPQATYRTTFCASRIIWGPAAGALTIFCATNVGLYLIPRTTPGTGDQLTNWRAQPSLSGRTGTRRE